MTESTTLSYDLNGRFYKFSTLKIKTKAVALMLGLSFCSNSTVALASSTEYVNLLESVALQQPEKLIAESLKSASSVNQVLSQNWLANTASITLHHENDALTGDQEAQNWEVGAAFPVLLPSQKEALRAVSSGYQQQVSAQEAYITWLASGKLRQLAWGYKKTQIEVDLAQSALEKSLELQEKVQNKVTVGESPQLDLLLAQKFVLTQQALLAQKLSLRDLAQKQFALWTQSDELPADITEVSHPRLSFENHPHLNWLQSFTGLVKAQISQQKSMSKSGPTFYLGAMNDHDRSVDNTSLVFEVTVPIGHNPMNQVEVAQKQQEMQGHTIQLLKAKQDLKEAVLAAEQSVAMNERNQRFSEQQSGIAQETLRLAEQAYQLGESSIQSLLLIQQQALEAKLNVELANANLGEAVASANQIMGYSLQSERVLAEGK